MPEEPPAPEDGPARRSRRVPIGFAHRGMRGRAPDNSVAGFRLALAAGARALEGDVWPTADGRAVLDHDGVVRRWGRRRPLHRAARAELAHLDALEDLYAACGSAFDLSLDVRDPRALDPVLDAARAAGAEHRLWLCHPEWRVVAAWRERTATAHLVDSTRRRDIGEGAEARLRALARAGVAVLNMPWPDWDAALVARCHEAGVLAFAWRVQPASVLRRVIALGVDAVYSDAVEDMVAVLGGVSAGGSG